MLPIASDGCWCSLSFAATCLLVRCLTKGSSASALKKNVLLVLIRNLCFTCRLCHSTDGRVEETSFGLWLTAVLPIFHHSPHLLPSPTPALAESMESSVNPRTKESGRPLGFCPCAAVGNNKLLQCKMTAHECQTERVKNAFRIAWDVLAFSLTVPQLYRRRPRALRRLAVGLRGGREGLRAQTQIVLTSGGGSGRAASSLHNAGHHGRERRIDIHTMGQAWDGDGVGVTGWTEDVRQWMSGGLLTDSSGGGGEGPEASEKCRDLSPTLAFGYLPPRCSAPSWMFPHELPAWQSSFLKSTWADPHSFIHSLKLGSDWLKIKKVTGESWRLTFTPLFQLS